MCKRRGGVLDVVALVSERVIKMNSPRGRGIPGDSTVLLSWSLRESVRVQGV